MKKDENYTKLKEAYEAIAYAYNTAKIYCRTLMGYKTTPADPTDASDMAIYYDVAAGEELFMQAFPEPLDIIEGLWVVSRLLNNAIEEYDDREADTTKWKNPFETKTITGGSFVIYGVATKLKGYLYEQVKQISRILCASDKGYTQTFISSLSRAEGVMRELCDMMGDID